MNIDGGVAMSRIVGDSLVGGPETAFAPEYVTVRMTRGRAESLAAAAEHVHECLEKAGYDGQARFLLEALSDIRAQIGGAP